MLAKMGEVLAVGGNLARKSTPSAVPSRPAALIKPREEVRARLLSRVEGGEEIRRRPVESPDELDKARDDYKQWDDFNEEFLRRAFSTEEYAIKYRSVSVVGGLYVARGGPSFADKHKMWADRVDAKVQQLTSLMGRLDLIEEDPTTAGPPATAGPAGPRPAPATDDKKVFIVHGQDEEAKAIVARFVERCGLSPIILHEQPNGGRTIIEKFEDEADVGFAIVLLTPDDVGGPSGGVDAGSTVLQSRARQNVILELGYFTGRLGRGRVAALKKGEIELPSDIYGVVWTPLSGDDAWKVSLARELRKAGYDIDVARALGL